MSVRIFGRFASLALLVLCGGVASAQTYPAKPLRMMIPFAPGAGTDAIGRILAGRMMFYEGCAHLPEWPRVPIGDEEGRIINDAIGRNGSIFIERAARAQLLAMAAGGIRPIKPEIAREAHDYRLKPRYVDGVFCYDARKVLEAPGPILA